MDLFGIFFSYMMPALLVGMLSAFVIKEAVDSRRNRAKKARCDEFKMQHTKNKKLYVYTFDTNDHNCT